jgi:hypothetical protein
MKIGTIVLIGLLAACRVYGDELSRGRTKRSSGKRAAIQLPYISEAAGLLRPGNSRRLTALTSIWHGLRLILVGETHRGGALLSIRGDAGRATRGPARDGQT